MAYVYEINGQRVEFEKEPTPQDIDEAARQLGPAPEQRSAIADEAQGLAQIAAVPAAGAINYALENPLSTAAGAAAAASYVPGLNKLPVVRDIKAVREGLVERFSPKPGPAIPGSPGNPIGGSGSGSSAPVRNIPINAQPTAPAQPIRPVMPQATYNVPTSNMPQMRAPLPGAVSGPVVPTAPAPTGGPLPSGMTAGEAPFRPPQQASILDKTTNMIRQLAANKVVQNMAKGGAGVAAALTPGNIGQNYNFPQTGPLRGSEINPQTGRPWTQQELAAYNQQYK